MPKPNASFFGLGKEEFAFIIIYIRSTPAPARFKSRRPPLSPLRAAATRVQTLEPPPSCLEPATITLEARPTAREDRCHPCAAPPLSLAVASASGTPPSASSSFAASSAIFSSATAAQLEPSVVPACAWHQAYLEFCNNLCSI